MAILPSSSARLSARAVAAFIAGSAAVFLALFVVARALLLMRNVGLTADIPTSELDKAFEVVLRFDLAM